MLPVSAARGDLFEIFVMAPGGEVADLFVGGSSLPDLVTNLMNSQGAFAGFVGIDFNASVTFLGIPDAIEVTFDAGTGEATFKFTLLGPLAQEFTFTGADLAGQIEQFLQDQLNQEIQAFLAAINTLSAVAVTDGSPMSTTALSASFVYDRFGLHADLTAAQKKAEQADQGKEPEYGFRGRVDIYYDTITTDVSSGNSFAIAPSLEYILSEQVSVGLLFPITYHDIGGAQILNVHANLAIPIYLIPPSDIGGVSLRITPFGTLAGSGSVDLIAGGLIGGGGILSTVTFDLGELMISATSQLSFHEGITLRYQGFEFDPGVSQRIFKGGIKLTQTIGDNMFFYGAITYSSFLEPAAIDNYLSPAAGIGFRAENGLNFSIGYSGDIADNFESHQLQARFQLPF